MRKFFVFALVAILLSSASTSFACGRRSRCSRCAVYSCQRYAQSGPAAAAPDPLPELPERTDWIYAEDEEYVKIEDAILETINAERSRYNLPPLEMVQAQRHQCRLHSRAMASRGGLFHAAGRECVAMNPVQDGCAVARQWLNSPAHRAIVMSRATKCSVGTFGRFHTFRIVGGR